MYIAVQTQSLQVFVYFGNSSCQVQVFEQQSLVKKAQSVQKMISSLSSLTNESYSTILENNDLKLNLNSPTESALQPSQIFPPNGQLLDFQQFDLHNEQNSDRERQSNMSQNPTGNFLPIRNTRRDTQQLFIKVDDNNYNCKLIDAPGVRHKRHFQQEDPHPSDTQRTEMVTQQDEEQKNYAHLQTLVMQYRQKIDELQSKNHSLEGNVQELQSCNRTLAAQLKNVTDNHFSKMESVKAIMRKKDEAVQTLTRKLAEAMAPNFEQTKLNKQLTKRLEKISAINKGLQKDLKEAMAKVVQLEKEAQVRATHELQENRMRFKDSIHNKENMDEPNTMNRKSLEGMKDKRSSRVTLDKKTKSIASITRLKFN